MTKVELYDPHPGIGGAALPLPKSLKELVDSLDGQVLTLEETIDRITPIAEGLGGRVEVHEKYQSISFQLRTGDNLPIHSYRLIRYRPHQLSITYSE